MPLCGHLEATDDHRSGREDLNRNRLEQSRFSPSEDGEHKQHRYGACSADEAPLVWTESCTRHGCELVGTSEESPEGVIPRCCELRSIRGWELYEHLPIRLHPSIEDPRLASERASQAAWATESMLRRLVSRRIDDHLLGIWGNPMAVRTEFTRWSGPCSRSRPIVTDPSVAETLAVLTFGRRSMARAAFIAQSAQSMERTPHRTSRSPPGRRTGSKSASSRTAS